MCIVRALHLQMSEQNANDARIHNFSLLEVKTSFVSVSLFVQT